MRRHFTLPYAYLTDGNLSDDIWTVRLVAQAAAGAGVWKRISEKKLNDANRNREDACGCVWSRTLLRAAVIERVSSCPRLVGPEVPAMSCGSSRSR